MCPDFLFSLSEKNEKCFSNPECNIDSEKKRTWFVIVTHTKSMEMAKVENSTSHVVYRHLNLKGSSLNDKGVTSLIFQERKSELQYNV